MAASVDYSKPPDKNKFLKDNVKKYLDTVNFKHTNTASKFNKSIIVFSGMTPDEIEDAREKIDFKQSKQKHFEKPLYCKALKPSPPSRMTPQLVMRISRIKMKTRMTRTRNQRMKQKLRKENLLPNQSLQRKFPRKMAE